MNKLFTKLVDLRFAIGAFFSLIGGILLFAGLSSSEMLAAGFSSSQINISTGGFFGTFGALMLLSSFLWKGDK